VKLDKLSNQLNNYPVNKYQCNLLNEFTPSGAAQVPTKAWGVVRRVSEKTGCRGASGWDTAADCVFGDRLML
jgi:hypothetical protein